MGRIDDDLLVNGTLQARTLIVPSSTITNAMVATGAGIVAEKLEHAPQGLFQQPTGTAAVSETRAVYLARYACTVEAFRAGVITPAVGAATLTFDLKKGGVSVLTGVVTINNTHTARQVVAGVLSGTVTLAAGDLLEVTTVATAGGGTLPQGAFADAAVFAMAQ